jgi:hypothetical protein
MALVLALHRRGIAQETTSGSIGGQVFDAQGAPVPDSTILLTSDQGAKVFTSDSNGRFFAPFLTPGRYALRVELAGFSPVERKGIDVRLGQRLDIAGLVLKVGTIEEQIDVSGASPTVDTSSTTVGGVLDSESLKHLPVGRKFTDTLYLVPGVSNSGGVGAANPSVSGASGLENNYVIDGVNVTHTGYGGVGGYSLVFGSLGSGVTQEFIKETQVKTGGFEAEYGSATGGVVNVVTQSGTNTLHGSVFVYDRPKVLESDWRKLETPNGTVNTANSWEYDFGASLGGPLVKDKVFFFGAIDPQFQRRTFIAPADFPAASADLGGPSVGEGNRERRILAYAGKASWQIDSHHRVEAGAFGDPSVGARGVQRDYMLFSSEPLKRLSDVVYGGHNLMARYDGVLRPSWLIEASFARAGTQVKETPAVDEWSVRDTTVIPNVRSGGIGYYEKGNVGQNLQYQLKSTHIFEAAGHHQVRYGVALESIRYDQINQITGPTFVLANGQRTATGAAIFLIDAPEVPEGHIFRVDASRNPALDTTQEYYDFFLQDTWQIRKRLTLRLGVRYERQKLLGADPGEAAAHNETLCHVDDSFSTAGDGSGAAIPCTVDFKGNYAPRLGAVFDVRGNGKAKVFVNFGRFYSRVPNDLAARSLSSDAGIARADYYDVGLTHPVPDGILAAGVTDHFLLPSNTPSQVSPDARSTYQQEVLVGFEIEALRRLNLGVRYVHRSINDVLEDYQPTPVVGFDLGCPGAGEINYLIGNISHTLPEFAGCDALGVPRASFEDPVHNYDSLELTANKSFSDNWSLMASYRYSKLRGNFEGFYRNDNGQSDPAISSLFDFPTNDPSYTQVGGPRFGYQGDIRFQGCTRGCSVLPNDRSHQFKVYGTYAPSALNLGLGLNASSGKPLTALASNPYYGNSGEIPIAPRATGFNTADGFRTRTPFEITVDLHAEYTIKLGGARRATLFTDAFNLFNRQSATDYDSFVDTGFGAGTLAAPQPNFGQPMSNARGPYPSYQTPRQVRIGARFEW